MRVIALLHKPFPDDPPLEQTRRDLLIGDVETVAEKRVGKIEATEPVHMCFSFKVGATPHKAAMRSMELVMSEVKPRVERALAPSFGSPGPAAAECRPASKLPDCLPQPKPTAMPSLEQRGARCYYED